MPPHELTKELSRRLATIDDQIARLADEREAVRILLDRLTPDGKAERRRSVAPSALGAVRWRAVDLMTAGEVVDTATMTARFRARGEVVSSKAVGNALARLASEGQLRRVSRGRYVLEFSEAAG